MPRLINAPLSLEYEELQEENEEFEREYNLLSESDEDPVGQWLKIAKARGDTSDSDQVLLTLIVELHRKIDNLSAYIKNEQVEHMPLANSHKIDSIGFENFQISTPSFIEGKSYYGRINMPVFPKREVPIYFKAISPTLALIQRLHERDEKDWNAYVTARERVMIREMKGEKNAD